MRIMNILSLIHRSIPTDSSTLGVIKMHKRHPVIYVLFALLLLIFATGCQEAPGENVIISKNDGVFETALENGRTKTTSPSTDGQVVSADQPQESQTQPVEYQSQFSSTDSSVHFTMDISEKVGVGPMYVVKVSPHYLTAEDAKRVAYSLFPNATFYEGESPLSDNYSKGEIQTKLNRWSQYLSPEALEDLLGEPPTENTLQILSTYIEEYTLKYEQAPEENPHQPCAWIMKKSSRYLLEEEDLATTDLSQDNDEVCTQFTSDEIPYRLSVSTRKQNDYKVNLITCIIDDGVSPRNIDERIFSSRLCRGAKPGQEQVLAICEKAESYLELFDLGQWQVDECYVSTRYVGDKPEYTIRVNAVPEFQGIPALRQRQLTSLRNPNGYAPSQYFTDAQFVFSPGGNLISFTMYTPLEIQEMIEMDDAIMTMDSLLSRAQEQLTLTDSHHYGLGDFVFILPEVVSCNVNISKMDFGIARVKIPEQDDSYYYVPAITLKGCAEYIGQETGKSYYRNDSEVALITLNAVDGTVINSTNT